MVADIEIPMPAPDEVLIEVKVAGVCGTDVHIYEGEYFGGYPRCQGMSFAMLWQIWVKMLDILVEGSEFQLTKYFLRGMFCLPAE